MFSKDWTTHWTVALGVLALALACAAPAVDAQIVEPYQMRLSNTVDKLSDDTATIDLSFTLIDVDVRGWSIAVCHSVDADTGDDVVEPSLIEASDTVNTSNDGKEPFFSATQIVAGEAFTIGVLVSSGTDVVGPGTDIEAYTITYDLLAEGAADLTFCTAGDPAVVSFFAIGGGADDDIRPAVSPGRVIVAPVAPFELTLEVPNPVFYPTTGTDAGLVDFDVQIFLFEIEEDSPTFPTDTLGFTLDLAYDPDIVEATDFVTSGVVGELRDGIGPAVELPTLDASGTAATMLVVYSFDGTTALVFDGEEASEVAEISFSTLDGVLPVVGVDEDTETSMRLEWSDEFGAVPVSNRVSHQVEEDIIEEEVTAIDETVMFKPIIPSERFIRGDCNNDLNVDIADGIYLLNARFNDGPQGPCAGACDITGDGTEDSTDAIYLFNHQFLEGPEPPAPFPDCAAPPDENEECLASACDD